MKRFWFWGVLVLLVAAYALGYWPERQRRVALEHDIGLLRAELALAQERTRLCALQGRLLGLMDTVAAQNYGDAQALSSSFFDEVRLESGRSGQPAFRETLEAILPLRDVVTAGLTKGDPGVLEPLRQTMSRLRAALEGRPTPAASPGAASLPAPSAAPTR